MMAEKSTGEDLPTIPSSSAATISRAFRRFRLPPITYYETHWRCCAMATLELYGSSQCPYTRELREWLEWTRRDFQEYDVDADSEALARVHALDSSILTVPVLVEDGRVIQIGWQGRGCILRSQ